MNAVGINSIGDKMKVVEYRNTMDVDVKFLDEYGEVVNTCWRYFSSGHVTNPFGRYLCGIGIVGGEQIRNPQGELSIEYTTWSRMIQRCYANSGRDKDERYIGCTVCDEWHLFKNFKDWMRSQDNYENWANLSDKGIDKDIVYKGNKIYAPDNCCLVPGYVNNLFTKHNKGRGIYPIGVSFHKRDKVFTATCHNPFTNKAEHLGYFGSVDDAFNAYKVCKESIIRSAAEKEFLSGTINKKCRDAMMRYQVEIDD